MSSSGVGPSRNPKIAKSAAQTIGGPQTCQAWLPYSSCSSRQSQTVSRRMP